MPLSKDALIAALQDLPNISFDISDRDFQGIADKFNAVQSLQKNAYENSWHQKLEQIKSITAVNTEIAPVITKLMENPKVDTILQNFSDNFIYKFDLKDFRETPGMSLIAFDGRYQLMDEGFYDFRFIQRLESYLTPDVDTVVEFGAGWGKNLGLLYMSNGRTDLTYMACEQSESGRIGFESIFKLNENLRYSSHPFDFYDASVDMLKGSRHVLAFTHAVIEQISFFPRSFIEDLLAVAEKVTLIFLEPIGWQRITSLTGFAIDALFKELHGIRPEDAFSPNYIFKFDDNSFLYNAMAWSIMGRYNMNLLSSINKVIENGLAKLVEIQYDVYGPNPVNPYTLVVLQKT